MWEDAATSKMTWLPLYGRCLQKQVVLGGPWMSAAQEEAKFL